MRPLPSAVGLLGFLKSITKRSRVRFYAGGLLSPPPRQQLRGCHVGNGAPSLTIVDHRRWPPLTVVAQVWQVRQDQYEVPGVCQSEVGVWRSEALLWPIIGNNDVVGRWQKDQNTLRSSNMSSG
ncbi:hypothetical protein Tco_1224866 [Tanacetum coccineum]